VVGVRSVQIYLTKTSEAVRDLGAPDLQKHDQPFKQAVQRSDGFIEGDLGARLQADGSTGLADLGKSPRESVWKTRQNQFVSNLRKPIRNGMKTIVAHRLDLLLWLLR